MSQALEKTVGRGNVRGGFLDFCRRKKLPVKGRGRGQGGGGEERGPGRAEKGGGWASFRPRGKGGVDGGSESGGCLCFAVCSGQGPASVPKCAQHGQLPGEVTAGTCARKCSLH